MSSTLQRWVDRLRSRPAELEVEDAYLRWAPTYGDGVAPLLDLEERLRRRLQPSFEMARVLDLGCGRGRASRGACEQGASLCLGLDPVLAMLARPLRRTAVDCNAAARAEALPLNSEVFDLVICSLVLGHLPRLDEVMGEIARVLRLDGRAVLTMFHPEAARRGWQRTFRHEASGECFAVKTERRSAGHYRDAIAKADLVVEESLEESWDGCNVLLGYLVRRA